LVKGHYHFKRYSFFAFAACELKCYLFHDILNQVTPLDVDFFSFSLDGPNSTVNDAIRGIG